MGTSINLNNVGKQFEGEWILKSVSLSFNHANCYHISGSNGSGKSTLLKLLAGFSIPSKGSINWSADGKIIDYTEINYHISWCAPYLELFLNLTLAQTFDFVAANKKMQVESALEFAKILELEHAIDKSLKNYSSGMLQRVKLGLAILSTSDFCLIDEPCSNLDSNAIEWYKILLQKHKKNRLVIIASNDDKNETFCCNQKINVADYKFY